MSMINWDVAERIGIATAGAGAGFTDLPGDLPALGVRAVEAVLATTALEPQSALPEPEFVDRTAWVRANAKIMQATVAPLERELGGQLASLPGPLRSVAGAAAGAEAGALIGYLGRRVLGQYELSLVGDPALDGPARLLLVAPNLHESAGRLLVPLDDLLAWVLVHEVTHAVQFASAPWLRGHLGSLLTQMLETAEADLKGVTGGGLPSVGDVRRLWDAARERGVLGLVSGTERGAQLDMIQAAMALVEGHAEYVMDAAGVALVADLPRLRVALDAGRNERSPFAALLERILGLDLKLRQYREGRAFCDAVVARAGMDGLNAAFAGPDALPTLAELGDADHWVARVLV